MASGAARSFSSPNNVPGPPINMGGTDPTITIPSAMVSLDDGNAIKAALPATGRIWLVPPPPNPERACHDGGVVLGTAMLLTCAGGDGFSVWTLDPAQGGSLENPKLLYSQAVPGVSMSCGAKPGFYLQIADLSEADRILAPHTALQWQG